MNKHLNEWEQTALVHLIEECAEVQKIATKILRFGLYSVNPATNNLNARDLELEVMDLIAYFRALEHQNIIAVWDAELRAAIEKRMKAIDEESEYEQKPSDVQSGEDSSST